MAAGAISDEINRHIEAVVALSKRDVLLRILHEAEVCLRSEQLMAAAVLATVAVEELHTSNIQGASDQDRKTFQLWRETRNRSNQFSDEKQFDRNGVEAIIRALRASMEQMEKPEHESRSVQAMADVLAETRGKYSFVNTSADEFIRRKRGDLDLENTR